MLTGAGTTLGNGIVQGVGVAETCSLEIRVLAPFYERALVPPQRGTGSAERDSSRPRPMGAEGECGPKPRALSAGVLAAGADGWPWCTRRRPSCDPLTAVVGAGLPGPTVGATCVLPCPSVPLGSGERMDTGFAIGGITSRPSEGLLRPITWPLSRMNTGFAPVRRHSSSWARKIARSASRGCSSTRG